MSFHLEEIKSIVKQVLQDKLGDKDFHLEYLRKYNDEILTEILNRLQTITYEKHSIQMKYVVTVLIGEKLGLHTALACLWDGTNDGCVTVKWENKKIFSIITVFGLAV